MANKDSAFGLRAIGKVGQNRDNQGLSEYSIAANSSAIFQNDPVQALATGYIGVNSANDGNLLGSLNGVFYTDSSSSKPTWANHLEASNTATDIVGFVSDDPYERFEIQSSGTLAIADINLNANLAYTAGASPNFISKCEVVTASGMTTSVKQIRVIGVAKDIENSEKQMLQHMQQMLTLLESLTNIT
jgi:cytochrome c-type biogenesis protein CcmE